MSNRIGWVAGIVVLCGVLLVFAHFSTDNLDFSRYNTGWNGTSLFFEQAGSAVMIDDAGGLGGYGNATLIIIAPAGNYTPGEIAAYQNFLSDGNTIVLLDDFGTGDQLLKGIGSNITLGTTTLASADHAYENVSLVRAYPEGNSTLAKNVPTITLDRPVAVEGGTPIFSSSLFTWGDENGDSKMSRDESMQRYTVGAGEQTGGGELIVIGDPSILINSMAGIDPGRDEFIRAILGLRQATLIDMTHSRTAGTGSSGGIIHMIQGSTLIQTIVLLAIAAAVAVTFRRGNH